MLPMIQLFLFGFAINANPRHLPTALVSADHSVYERDFGERARRTPSISISDRIHSAAAADEALRRGDVLFVLEIPPDFRAARGPAAKPQILMDADGSDPMAIGNATAALGALNASVLNRDLPPDLRVRRRRRRRSRSCCTRATTPSRSPRSISCPG